MTTATVNHIPGQPDRITAQDEAIRQGYNCYSKAAEPWYQDFRTEREAVFYYKWKGQVLEVIVNLVPSADPYGSDESNTAEPATAVQEVRQQGEPVTLLLFNPANF